MFLSEEMVGLLSSKLQSYDLKDNPKYQAIEFLAGLMDENLGVRSGLIQDLRTSYDHPSISTVPLGSIEMT